MFRSIALAVVGLTLSGQAAVGQQWARDLFQTTSHSFGVVAHGAKTQHAFEFSNPYAVDLHVTAVRTSCGCTTPTISKRTLRTYEKGAIVATFNTDRFRGHRSATITVTFDRPRYAEVQLQVRGDIRSDVEVTPSAIVFGSVDRGQTADRSVEVRHYASGNWTVVGVENCPDFLTVQLQPATTPYGGTTYRLRAQLKKSAPVGYFRRQLVLRTNDRSMPQVPINVEGQVIPPVTVSPPVLFLGAVPPGQQVSKKLIVRAKRPFKILAIEPADERFSFQLAEQSRKVHVVPMTFTAGQDVAKVEETLHIRTDLDDASEATCKVSVAVIHPVAAN